MENKSNEATPQRPEGNRLLDAQIVTMDLNLLMEQVRNESSWRDSDRNSITVYKSDKMRIVLIGLHEHADLKTHAATGPISVQVLDGHIQFTTEHKVAELKKGQMLALQQQVSHSVLALKETFFLLTMAMV